VRLVGPNARRDKCCATYHFAASERARLSINGVVTHGVGKSLLAIFEIIFNRKRQTTVEKLVPLKQGGTTGYCEGGKASTVGARELHVLHIWL